MTIITDSTKNVEFVEVHIPGIDDDAEQGLRMAETQAKQRQALLEYNARMGVEDGMILFALPSKRR